ncbi:pentapeptide repeat-containing protein [Streptomyces sp. NPDC058583]|uniref:pentapeptide repeat-containing protein n=1 Tax=unclassified Streptomyces TaxID=2593676 RepID=UPI0036667E90
MTQSTLRDASPPAPDWPRCDHATDPADPAGAAPAADGAGSGGSGRAGGLALSAGCRGIRVSGHTFCLAHLDGAARAAHLGTLSPGAHIDHRGTTFTEELLGELLAAVTDPGTHRPRLGLTELDQATFDGPADFGGARFDGDAHFDHAVFHGDAVFDAVEFGGAVRFAKAEISRDAQFAGARVGGDAWFDQTRTGGHAYFDDAKFGAGVWFTASHIAGDARFCGAEFTGSAWFDQVRFGGGALFGGAEFRGDGRFEYVKITGAAQFPLVKVAGDALFRGAEFHAGALFREAEFSGAVQLDGVWIKGDGSFRRVAFERATTVGPLMCTGTAELSEAVFGTAVTIEIEAAAVRCHRTRWASTGAMRLRRAVVDLNDAVWEYPISVSSAPEPPLTVGAAPAEPGRPHPRVRVASLRGVDAAHLVLTDVDLSACLFAGTVHLDQIRLEGRYLLTTTPPGLYRRGWWPARWTPRRTLAEEHHWRAARAAGGGPGTDGWMTAPPGQRILTPAALAPVYRQLRKSFEDGKHEPGAADFYYGEMEMRRHADDIPLGERSLLTAYWALSGYGLRASRALLWLLGAMTATVLALMLWGLPQNEPRPTSTGALVGNTVTMTTAAPEPVNPEGPYGSRLSTERFEKALRSVINSVVFRSSGQDLTTAGTYTEMASRLAEPVLLGMAFLAVRNRVKR